MNLRAHYQQLWQKSLAQFEAGQFELDPLLDSAQDTRRGLTLLLRPAEEVKTRIQHCLQELASLEPEQYYYPPSDLHVTVLSIISCYSDFELRQIDTVAYQALVQQAIQNTPSFQIDFTGLTASPSCVLVQGFPMGEELNNLRHHLRETFKTSGLQQSIDQRYALQTAHSTVVRFRKPLRQPQKFLEKLQEYREAAFGVSTVHEVELVYNDWYQRQAETEVLFKFSLD